MSYPSRHQSFASCETGASAQRSRVDPGKLLALIHRIKTASDAPSPTPVIAPVRAGSEAKTG